jgi:hypothetical protein
VLEITVEVPESFVTQILGTAAACPEHLYTWNLTTGKVAVVKMSKTSLFNAVGDDQVGFTARSDQRTDAMAYIGFGSRLVFFSYTGFAGSSEIVRLADRAVARLAP